MSDGYEIEELPRIEAALDALVSPTSEDVFQATRPFDERAIASVAAKRAGHGSGGSQPSLADVLTTGGDPDGHAVTGPLYVDNPDAATPALIVDGGLHSLGTDGQIALFRKSNGELVGYIGAVSGLFAPGVDKPTLELSKDQCVVNLDPDISGLFIVSDNDGNSLLTVLATGAVQIEPPPDSTDDPLDVRLQDGSLGCRVTFGGTFYFPGFHARVTPDGAFVTSAHAAPDDADLSAGEMALWFDETDGAAKLMVKAKSANGTVRTGNLALT